MNFMPLPLPWTAAEWKQFSVTRISQDPRMVDWLVKWDLALAPQADKYLQLAARAHILGVSTLAEARSHPRAAEADAFNEKSPVDASLIASLLEIASAKAGFFADAAEWREYMSVITAAVKLMLREIQIVPELAHAIRRKIGILETAEIGCAIAAINEHFAKDGHLPRRRPGPFVFHARFMQFPGGFRAGYN